LSLALYTRRNFYAKFSGNRNSSRLFGMLKLAVTAFGANVVPAVLLQ